MDNKNKKKSRNKIKKAKIVATDKVQATTDIAPYLFHQGTNFQSYKYLGVHKINSDKNPSQYVVRVWAPNADKVYLTGDFNQWTDSLPLTHNKENEIWELTFPLEFDNSQYQKYKFKIVKNGVEHYKADPYAVFSETEEKTASILYELPNFKWNDKQWLTARKKTICTSRTYAYDAPVNIYEVHLGSWKKHEDDTYYTYRETADDLSVYAKQMGYTHIELMPIMEHPFNGSWGYQICGFYAPTSRFGTPEDFMYFVNKMHEAGIGVILDWVPAHFPKDAHGLYEFDGTPLYEYQGEDRMEHKGWGTRFFDVGREEVQSFLISNALYWLTEFHIDGLRVDAVASMLYLDYDKKDGEWTPAFDGSNKNYEAISFFQKLNCTIFGKFSDVLMIAEESTAWPMVTRPVHEGGLGFNFKWNMGWMNDMLKYVETDPLFRKYSHSALTFSLMYAFNENFVLPISHDEVVHGKKSLIDKMFGSYEEKFAALRLFFGYMMTHPGKKLNFMGNEFGQFKEWDFASSLEWFMLNFEKHKQLLTYSAELNNFYLAHRELWEIDTSWDGFKWIRYDDADENITVFMRLDSKGNFLICAMNFAPVLRHNFTFGVPVDATYKEVFSSDEIRFGGNGYSNGAKIEAKELTIDNLPYSISVTLPPFSCTMFQIDKKKIIK